jgi:outer membrane receptor for monomeric catechols
MAARALQTIAVIALCLVNGAFAVAGERPRHKPRLGETAVRVPAAARDPYADPAAPYKADRLAAPGAQPIANLPGQTTVLTRDVLDDMNARSVKDALGSTAGVTIGR